MPNWNDTVIMAKNPDLLRRYTTDGQFDFNMFASMPEELDVPAGCAYEAIACFLSEHRTQPVDEEKIKALYNEYEGRPMPEDEMEYVRREPGSDERCDELYAHGKAYLDNYRKYGSFHWFDWRVKHWGTKWNASETSFEPDGTVHFMTPWCMPKPIFEEMCRMNPEEKIIFVAYGDNSSGLFTNDHGTLKTIYYRENSRIYFSTLIKNANKLKRTEFAS